MSTDGITREEQDQLLDAGITQTSTDGATATYDLEFIQKRRNENARNDRTAMANGEVRKRVYRSNFSRM